MWGFISSLYMGRKQFKQFKFKLTVAMDKMTLIKKEQIPLINEIIILNRYISSLSGMNVYL